MDPAPPVISSINVTNITDDTATITWTTDQQADSVVDYGVTSLYGSVASDLALSINHSITLTGLSQGTLYHFMVTSTSDKGVSASSGDNTFSTTGPITITIVSPVDNDTINRADVMVRGTVTNSTGNETGVTVNDVVAVVYNGEFFVNHVSLQDSQNTITANAVDTAGNSSSHAILVDAVTTDPHITLRANIESGISPLTTYFSVSTSIPNAVSSYAFDYEGDAVPDITGAVFEDISFTYSTEGVYYPMITITDDQGLMYSDTIAIIVLNQNDLDALLQAKWTAMKTALAIGDADAAVANFELTSQDTFRDQFTALETVLSNIVNELESSQVSMISLEEDIAIYEILVMREGSTYSLQLKFIKDSQGIWKIWGF